MPRRPRHGRGAPGADLVQRHHVQAESPPFRHGQGPRRSPEPHQPAGHGLDPDRRPAQRQPHPRRRPILPAQHEADARRTQGRAAARRRAPRDNRHDTPPPHETEGQIRAPSPETPKSTWWTEVYQAGISGRSGHAQQSTAVTPPSGLGDRPRRQRYVQPQPFRSPAGISSPHPAATTKAGSLIMARPIAARSSTAPIGAGRGLSVARRAK